MISAKPSIRYPLVRLKAALGRRPATAEETYLRLKNSWGRASDNRKSFPFPWGDVEYVQFGQLRSQFEEIFVEELYSFVPSGPNPTIVDCGGNIGMSSIWFKLKYPESNLTVFEPDPDLCSVLQRNLDRACLKSVCIRNEAVWISDGTVSFDRQGDDSGRIAETSGFSVKAVDLAKVLPENVDLLKLDVEGAEFELIPHLARVGKLSEIRALVAELHVRRDRTDDMLRSLELLRQAGFALGFNASLCPWIGRAPRAPFSAVGEDQVLMMLYAWRK